MRRALQLRDNGCRHPGCDSTRVDSHPMRHWADGGETSLQNLILLCRYHHRLVHEGGFGVNRGESVESGEIVFSRPDGSIIPTASKMPQGRPLPNIAVKPWSWNGDMMDNGLAIDSLLSYDKKRKKVPAEMRPRKGDT